MEDAAAVRGSERVGDLRADVQHLGERQRSPSQAIGEGLPFHVLHDEEVQGAAGRVGL